jgi:intein/homing endonuclease
VPLFRRKRKYQRKKKIEWEINPETAREIIAIVLIIFGGLFLLSILGLAGSLGYFLSHLVKLLLGYLAIPFSLVLLFLGVALFMPKKIQIKPASAVGASLFFLFMPALVHLFVDESVALDLAKQGRGGGLIGFLFSYIFSHFLGFWASLLILLGLVMVSFMITFSVTLSSIFNFFTSRLKRPKTVPVEVHGGDVPVLTMMKKEPLKESEKPLPGAYQLPPLDLLAEPSTGPTSGDINKNVSIIAKTLANFGISVVMSDVNIGPTVTQYSLKPAEGVRLSQITARANDLALALAAHPIRIEAPIPGKALVGIEVPNQKRAVVTLKEIFLSREWREHKCKLPIALGRDVAGTPMVVNLEKMPHLLVAGSTGSGKTAAADTLIFTEKGMLTFKELCPLPLNSETEFKIKIVTRDGIETTAKNYNNGICQFYKLSTKRGYQIEVTPEHPLWVMNEDGSQGWKPASLIKKGDYVAISRGPALFGNKVDLSDFKPSKIKAYHRKISFPKRMTPLLAEFLGLLAADGGLSVEKGGTHRVVYTQADHYLLALYKKSLKELFGITQFIEKRSGSNPENKAFDIVIGSKHLKEFLAYLGMNSCKSSQKEIPRAIREAPKEIVSAYLRALFDNDGYVGENSIDLCISSKKLASQVHLLLLNFGIVSSLNTKRVKNYAHNEYYRLSISGEDARKFIQEIGFLRKEKYNKAKEFLKLSPNPNTDLIPHIHSLLKRMGQKYLNRFAQLTNRGWKYQSGILIPKYAFSSLKSYNSGFRMPGYQSLERILDFYQPISQEPEYQELKKISERNFYWDKIEKIERTSGIGYDFYVPGSDSFVGNGFVNHNTIFLNTLILSHLYAKTPEEVKFILIDPKRVEFTHYNGLPHLLAPVVVDLDKTVSTLKWTVAEMERRYKIFQEANKRDIDVYNQSQQEKMPYIVVIIDELADLMALAASEVEASIVRIAQMARATGIHLVVATQRPSVDIITGLIKANISARIAFAVASQVDSRTILDMAGAEKLLGGGDMLYQASDIAKPRRIQGPMVKEGEVKRVTDFIKAQAPQVSYSEEVFSYKPEPKQIEGTPSDELYEQAVEVVTSAGKASASLLQRRLRIGYARAARLLDLLEQKGIIGPAEGSKPRDVLKE